MGCRLAPYWLGNYLFDLLVMLFLVAIFLSLGSILGNLDIVRKALLDWTLILVSTSGAVLSLSYYFSYKYETSV